MDKHLSKISWNRELKDLWDIKGQQGTQQNVEPKKLELTEYKERYSHHIKTGKPKERIQLKKRSHVLLLFTVIITGIFAGSFILTSGIASVANGAWKEAANEYSIFSGSSDPKNKAVQYNIQPSDNNFQQELVRQNLGRYAQLRAVQKAKEIAEKQKEESAFRAVYKKPSQCYSPETIEIKMRCINDYVRARKRFDEIYASNLALVNGNVVKASKLNTTIKSASNNQ